MVSFIKIYGERNTNTNYLEKIIEKNLKVGIIPGVPPPWILRLNGLLAGTQVVKDAWSSFGFSNNLGWKHCKVSSVDSIKDSKTFENNEVGFITITKNPYSWLLSLHRNPYSQYVKKGQSFEEFIASPWRCFRRDNIAGIVKNPVMLWNIKNNSYFNLDPLDTIHLKTESILESPSNVIDMLSIRFNLDKLSNSFVGYERSTKDNVGKSYDYYRDYYINQRWKDSLSDNAVTFINSYLDKQLMKNFDYEVL